MNFFDIFILFGVVSMIAAFSYLLYGMKKASDNML